MGTYKSKISKTQRKSITEKVSQWLIVIRLKFVCLSDNYINASRARWILWTGKNTVKVLLGLLGPWRWDR